MSDKIPLIVLMKIDPINILINSKFKTDKPFYFISGNEHTLIYKVKESLIKIINKDGDFDLEKIKDIGSFKNNIGLFNDKNIPSGRGVWC